jgi:hypothetical protein
VAQQHWSPDISTFPLNLVILERAPSNSAPNLLLVVIHNCITHAVQAVHPVSHKFKVLVQVKTQEEEGKWHETFQVSSILCLSAHFSFTPSFSSHLLSNM